MREPAVCAEAMAAAAPTAAGEDGQGWRPGAALGPQPQDGARVEAESGELGRLRAELAGALAEMETMKAVAEVSESTKAEAVAAVQRHCQEEVASLQAILKDSISSYEAQIASLKQEQQQQQQDCEEKERELGRLKQLLSRAHPLDSLEKQMEKVGVGMAYLPHPHPSWIWKDVEAAKGDWGAEGLLVSLPRSLGAGYPVINIV